MFESIENRETTESSDIVLKVHDAQIRQLYRQTLGGLSGIMILMVAVCIALWQEIAHWKLVSWSAALVLLSVARGLSVAAFQRKASFGPRMYLWARMHVVGAIASGVMWAIPSVCLWPDHSAEHQMVWPICIVALAASAVAKYCIWTPAYLPYLMLTMLPISFRLFWEGGLVYTVLGVMGLVFTAILGQTGKVMHDASLRALEVGIRNEALNDILSAEKAKEEALNTQLQQEIVERAQSQEELRLRNQELECLNTQLNATTRNLETVNQELAQALIDIKKLGGMVPICASCKKIRNDQGYWQQIESYLRQHSEVEFSHGICPDCAKVLYPEYRPKK